MLWLKHCMVLARSLDGLYSNVILSVERLAHGMFLALLPAMVCNLKQGLQELCTSIFGTP